jgi:hypothetical protein
MLPAKWKRVLGLLADAAYYLALFAAIMCMYLGWLFFGILCGIIWRVS